MCENIIMYRDANRRQHFFSTLLKQRSVSSADDHYTDCRRHNVALQWSPAVFTIFTKLFTHSVELLSSVIRIPKTCSLSYSIRCESKLCPLKLTYLSKFVHIQHTAWAIGKTKSSSFYPQGPEYVQYQLLASNSWSPSSHMGKLQCS